MEKRTVVYYTIINPLKFSDGFEVKNGQKAILISEDKESDMVELQIEDKDSKRIFWTEISNIKLKTTKTEKWTKAKAIQHDIDINEKWLENEQRTITAEKIVGTRKNTKTSKIAVRVAGNIKRRKVDETRRTNRRTGKGDRSGTKTREGKAGSKNKPKSTTQAKKRTTKSINKRGTRKKN